MKGRGRSRFLGAPVAVLAALLVAPATAAATPTCPGADRTLCGGRIIPEPDHTAGFLTHNEWVGAMRELPKEHPHPVRFHQNGQTAGARTPFDVRGSDFAAKRPRSPR